MKEKAKNHLGEVLNQLNPWLLPKMISSNQFLYLKLPRSKLEEEELFLLMEEEAQEEEETILLVLVMEEKALEEEEVSCLMEEEGEGVLWSGKGSSTGQR